MSPAGEDVDAGPFGGPDWRQRRAQVEAAAQTWGPQTLAGLLDMVKQHHHDLGRLNAILQMLRSRGVEVVDGLARLLRDNEADVRLYAALALGESGSDAAIGPLIEALDDLDVNVVQTSIEGLKKRSARQAVPQLLAFLDHDFFLAFSAVEALGVLGDGNETVVARLLALLDDDLLAEEAVRALGRLQLRRVVVPVARWLEAHPDQGESAFIALVQIHGAANAAAQRRIEAEIVREVSTRTVLETAERNAPIDGLQRAIAVTCGWYLETSEPSEQTRLRECLLRLVDHPDAAEAAIDALVMSGPHVMQTLVGRTFTADSATRCMLARALGRLRQPEVVPVLTSLIDADDVDLTVAALKSLRDLRQPACVDQILDCLGHPSPRVRLEAVSAVSACMPPAQVRLLIPLSTHADPRIRESVMRVLGELPFEAVSWLLLLGLDDPEASVRKCAIESLTGVIDANADVQARVAEMLTTESAETVRAAAARSLGFAPSEKARPLLLQALGDPDAWTRLHACHGLERFKNPLDAQRIRPLCSDAEPFVRCAAAAALASNPDPETIVALRRLVADPSDDVAIAAARALAATDSPQTVAALTDAIKTAPPRRHTLITSALLRIATPTALQVAGRREPSA